MSNYPSGYDNFGHKTDLLDLVQAADVNELQDAIEAIEGELGLNPSGGYATLVERLNADVCANGATLPSSPIIGQWFLHTPTGRKVLMMYDGSAWKPIISLGAMTVYVNDASGTDAPDKGYGTGANAFKTIHYAIDAIPGSYSGDININVAAGTYAPFTIRSKYPTGNYRIYIYGTLQTDATGTITGGSKGLNENHATVVVNGAGWTDNQWEGYLATIGSDTRVIRSNTADTLQLVGYLGSDPSGTVTIKSQATSISSGITYIYARNIYLNQIYFNECRISILYGGQLSITFCKLEHNTDRALDIQMQSTVGLGYDYIYTTGNTYFCLILLYDNSIIKPISGTYLQNKGLRTIEGIRVDDSEAAINGGVIVLDNFNIGIRARNNAMALFNSIGTNIILNCNTGLYVEILSSADSNVLVYYSGCTTNYTAVAASYGYIG